MLKKSCKGSKTLAYLEKLIDEIDPHQDTSRPGKFNRAIENAIKISKDEWQELAKELKKFKNEVPHDIATPTALQVKVNENLETTLVLVEEALKNSLELTTLQTRYEFEILWFSYLQHLKEDIMKVGDMKKNGAEDDLTGPDMVKKLVHILLLNRESDREVIEKIKLALLEWEEKF